jgi:hypothetical protein
MEAVERVSEWHNLVAFPSDTSVAAVSTTLIGLPLGGREGTKRVLSEAGRRRVLFVQLPGVERLLWYRRTVSEGTRDRWLRVYEASGCLCRGTARPDSLADRSQDPLGKAPRILTSSRMPADPLASKPLSGCRGRALGYRAMLREAKSIWGGSLRGEKFPGWRHHYADLQLAIFSFAHQVRLWKKHQLFRVAA